MKKEISISYFNNNFVLYSHASLNIHIANYLFFTFYSVLTVLKPLKYIKVLSKLKSKISYNLIQEVT